jgi:hypothetical protein
LARYGGDVIESWFEASPAVVDEHDAAEADEQRVIGETAFCLAERQPVMDLPPLVVEAASGDHSVKEMSRRVKSREDAPFTLVPRDQDRRPARLRIPPAERR